jgi:glycosyltransferase involved in cell wall biosynthesis
MNSKVCCIFNLAPHYRAPIFKLMDEEFECDFYFGEKVQTHIKLMDYEELKGFKKILPNTYIPRTGFEWQKGAWQLILKPHAHYIITGTPGSLSNWLLALLAIPLGKKVYAWTHGVTRNLTPAGKLIAKSFYHICHKILLYGEDSKKIMLEEGFSEEKLIPIYNSLDYAKQIIIREKLVPSKIYEEYFKNNNPVIIYIGRIQKRKKIDFLVKAVNDLNKQGVACNLVIVGSDVDNNGIPELISDLKIANNVWMYGACYEEAKIAELLFNAHACVTPGPVGLTALHALTYGCPVISNNDFKTQMPEYEAVVPGVNGDFFELDNLDSLKDTIIKWINLDSIQRKEARKGAYKVIDEKYNPHYQINILKNLMQK